VAVAALLLTGCTDSRGAGEASQAATVDQGTGATDGTAPPSTPGDDVAVVPTDPTTTATAPNPAPTTTVPKAPPSTSTVRSVQPPPAPTTTAAAGPPVVVASNGSCVRNDANNWTVTITFTFVNGIADNLYVENWLNAPRGPIPPGTSSTVFVGWGVGGTNPTPPLVKVTNLVWRTLSGDRNVAITPVSIACP